MDSLEIYKKNYRACKIHVQKKLCDTIASTQPNLLWQDVDSAMKDENPEIRHSINAEVVTFVRMSEFIYVLERILNTK